MPVHKDRKELKTMLLRYVHATVTCITQGLHALGWAKVGTPTGVLSGAHSEPSVVGGISGALSPSVTPKMALFPADDLFRKSGSSLLRFWGRGHTLDVSFCWDEILGLRRGGGGGQTRFSAPSHASGVAVKVNVTGLREVGI